MLEAGVRIYALRVDSAHSQAFKLLAQIIRAWGEDQGLALLWQFQNQHVTSFVLTQNIKMSLRKSLYPCISL